MKRDPMHKQIVKTADVFVSDENSEEALEAAVDKKQLLMKGLFGDTPSDTFQNDAEYFNYSKANHTLTQKAGHWTCLKFIRRCWA